MARQRRLTAATSAMAQRRLLPFSGFLLLTLLQSFLLLGVVSAQQDQGTANAPTTSAGTAPMTLSSPSNAAYLKEYVEEAARKWRALELYIIIAFAIVLLLSLGVIAYFRFNRALAYRGKDSAASQKVILPAYEPFFVAIVLVSLFGFLSSAIIHFGRFVGEFDNVSTTAFISARVFIVFAPAILVMERSIARDSVYRTMWISAALSFPPVIVAIVRKQTNFDANLSEYILITIKVVWLLVTLFNIARPCDSRATKLAIREYNAFIAVYFVSQIIYSILFIEVDDYNPGLRATIASATIWMLNPIFVARLLLADTQYWRRLGQRSLELQSKLKDVTSADGSAFEVDYVTSTGLHVFIEMHRKHIIDFSVLEFGKRIGVGASSTVFQGVLRGQRKVAIKVYTPREVTEAEVAAFSHEAALCASLSLHPNVVQFYGLCVSPPHICLVVELCPLGSLEDVLKAERRAGRRRRRKVKNGSAASFTKGITKGDLEAGAEGAGGGGGEGHGKKSSHGSSSVRGDEHPHPHIEGSSEGTEEYDVEDFEDQDSSAAAFRLQVNFLRMLDAARAVAYLHHFQPAFLHRDIKPGNFVVDGNGNVKLTDFGESRTIVIKEMQRRRRSSSRKKLANRLQRSLQRVFSSASSAIGSACDAVVLRRARHKASESFDGLHHQQVDPEELELRRFNQALNGKMEKDYLQEAEEEDDEEGRYTDFSSWEHRSRAAMTIKGTSDYMAPELIEGRAGNAVYGASADVYALAITFWDILHGARPKYPAARGHHLKIYQAVLAGERPEFGPCTSSQCPEEVRELICRMWDTQPEKRPSSKEVVETLEGLLESILQPVGRMLWEHAPLVEKKVKGLTPRSSLNSGFTGSARESQLSSSTSNLQLCFGGEQATRLMTESGWVARREDAVRLGNGLMDAGIVHHTAHKLPFRASKNAFYTVIDPPGEDRGGPSLTDSEDPRSRTGSQQRQSVNGGKKKWLLIDPDSLLRYSSITQQPSGAPQGGGAAAAAGTDGSSSGAADDSSSSFSAFSQATSSVSRPFAAGGNSGGGRDDETNGSQSATGGSTNFLATFVGSGVRVTQTTCNCRKLALGLKKPPRRLSTFLDTFIRRKQQEREADDEDDEEEEEDEDEHDHLENGRTYKSVGSRRQQQRQQQRHLRVEGIDEEEEDEDFDDEDGTGDFEYTEEDPSPVYSDTIRNSQSRAAGGKDNSFYGLIATPKEENFTRYLTR